MENKIITKKTTTTKEVVLQPIGQVQPTTTTTTTTTKTQPQQPVQYLLVQEPKKAKASKKSHTNPDQEKAKKLFTILGRTTAAIGFLAVLLYIVYTISMVWVTKINSASSTESAAFANMMSTFAWVINITFLAFNAIIIGLCIASGLFVNKMNSFAKRQDKSPFVVWGISVLVILVFIGVGVAFAVVASKDTGNTYLPWTMFVPVACGDLTIAIFTLIKVKSALKTWGRIR